MLTGRAALLIGRAALLTGPETRCVHLFSGREVVGVHMFRVLEGNVFEFMCLAALSQLGALVAQGKGPGLSRVGV